MEAKSYKKLIIPVLYSIGCILFQVALSDLRKCSDRSHKSAKKTLQITLLFGHTRTTYSAVKYINVYVNINCCCCPLGLMNVNKQTVVIVGQLKVISIKTPEKIPQSMKSSTVKM